MKNKKKVMLVAALLVALGSLGVQATVYKQDVIYCWGFEDGSPGASPGAIYLLQKNVV